MSALVDALDRLREPVAAGVVELTPAGGAPTSKPKRGALVAALLLVSLFSVTLGWMSRGRVEVARVSESVSRVPTAAPKPCAVEETDRTVISDVLIITCSRIRAGDLLGAARLWDTEVYNRRTDDDLALLRAQTLIVARTFNDQAERFRRWAWVTQSVHWTAMALRWPIPEDPVVVASDRADACVALLKQLAPEDPDPLPEGLSAEDPDPQNIRERIR